MTRGDLLARLRERDRSTGTDPLRVTGVEDDDLDRWDRWQDAPDRLQAVTSSVYSRVFDGERDLLGHILMVEYDDVDPEVPVEDAEGFPGVAVVLRSSRRSYHVVDLGVRSWGSVVGLATDSRGERDHVDAMVSEGRFALRTQPKVLKVGDVYKPAPEPVYVASGEYQDPPLSAPHLTVLRQMCEETDRLDVDSSLSTVESAAELTGETLSLDRYETPTDELNELIEDAGGL